MGLVFALLAGCGEPAVVFDPAATWPAQDPVSTSDTPRLYVANGADDTLSIVEIDPLVEVGRVPVGLVPVQPEGLAEIAISRELGSVFVGVTNDAPDDGSGPHEAHAPQASIDGYTIAIGLDDADLGSARVDARPGDLTVLPGGTTLLQSHFDLGLAISVLHTERPLEEADTRLEVIDAATMDVRSRPLVCPAPSGLALSADAGEAYLACYGSDEIALVDLSGDPAEVARIPVGDTPHFAHPYYSPRNVAVSPSDGKVWTSCWMDGAGQDAPGELRVFDPASREILDEPRPTFRGNPMQAVFNSDGSRLYVPLRISDLVAIVDTTTGEIVRDAENRLMQAPMPCLRVHAAVLSPDESKLFVLCEGDHEGPGEVLAVDAETLEVLESVEVGVWPTDLEPVY